MGRSPDIRDDDGVNGFWKLLEDSGYVLLVVAVASGTGWAGKSLSIGRAAGRRVARWLHHRERIRELQLEAKRRELEDAHPQPVEPVCGCGHNLAFHDIKTNACRHRVGETTCSCQRYTGPEPWVQVYLPPMSEPGGGSF